MLVKLNCRGPFFPLAAFKVIINVPGSLMHTGKNYTFTSISKKNTGLSWLWSYLYKIRGIAGQLNIQGSLITQMVVVWSAAAGAIFVSPTTVVPRAALAGPRAPHHTTVSSYLCKNTDQEKIVRVLLNTSNTWILYSYRSLTLQKYLWNIFASKDPRRL